MWLKSIDYEYDALGRVKKIIYQKNTFSERFDHEYIYDPDGRLYSVYTEEYYDQGTLKDQQLQAKYFYYKHGLQNALQCFSKGGRFFRGISIGIPITFIPPEILSFEFSSNSSTSSLFFIPGLQHKFRFHPKFLNTPR